MRHHYNFIFYCKIILAQYSRFRVGDCKDSLMNDEQSLVLYFGNFACKRTREGNELTSVYCQTKIYKTCLYVYSPPSTTLITCI